MTSETKVGGVVSRPKGQRNPRITQFRDVVRFIACSSFQYKAGAYDTGILKKLEKLLCNQYIGILIYNQSFKILGVLHKIIILIVNPCVLNLF